MSIRALGYLGIEAANLDEWRSFVTTDLGMMAVERSDGTLDLRIDDYAWRVRLSRGARDDIAYVGWEVSGRQALETLESRLRNAGYETELAGSSLCDERRVAGLIQFEDPDGLLSEAFYGPLLTTESQFISPQAVAFKTGGQGLGHVVLSTADKDRMTGFYEEVLGFRLTDVINTEVVPGNPLSISFFRCNRRHHSLALVPAPLPKRLVHLMLETRSIDDVGRAMYRVVERGRHLSFTLGRHSNDQMLSFYVSTPSGFDLEYGWGGLSVDDDSWHVKTHTSNSVWGHKFQRPQKAR